MQVSTLRASAALTLVFLCLAGCSMFRDSKPPRVSPTFSPNGEMLSPGGRGAPECPELLGAWWDRLAAQNGGKFARAAFLADAERQFLAMDLDHDGFITASELSEYRQGLEEAQRDDTPRGPDGRVLGPPTPPETGGRHGRRGDQQGPQARYGSPIPADMVDPVMSADRSLSFKVSHEDFMVQANEIAKELDKDHQGLINREALIATCPKR